MCFGFSEQFHIQQSVVDHDGKAKLKHRLWSVILWSILRRRKYLSVGDGVISDQRIVNDVEGSGHVLI
jgi:hypothetical protein